MLDAKGGEIKAKASKWISYHLRILKIVELVLLICLNALVVSYCQKLVSCRENVWLWEKGGVFESFWIFNQFLLEYLSLYLNKCVWLRDRKLSLIYKNKPSGGKEWSKYAKFESKTILVLICTSMCCFLLCWHKSPKKGRLKGKCALGPFLSILVIKC